MLSVVRNPGRNPDHTRSLTRTRNRIPNRKCNHRLSRKRYLRLSWKRNHRPCRKLNQQTERETEPKTEPQTQLREHSESETQHTTLSLVDETVDIDNDDDLRRLAAIQMEICCQHCQAATARRATIWQQVTENPHGLRKQKMKLNLAAQVISSRVADAIAYCDHDLSLPKFAETYITCLTDKTGLLLTSSRRRTRFLGFLICVRRARNVFDDAVGPVCRCF